MIFACITSSQAFAHAQTIALDIGHTPNQPGAISAYGVNEYTYNKQFVLQLEALLKQANIHSNIINLEGNEISLDDRVNEAKNLQSNLLLSIHHDSVQANHLTPWQVNGSTYLMSNYAQGYGIFISRQQTNWQQSYECAKSIGTALKNAGFKPSLHHATDEINEQKPLADSELGIYFYDGLRILRTAPMPAILIEVGVIVHPDEALTLKNHAHQLKQARAIVDGLKLCTTQKLD